MADWVITIGQLYKLFPKYRWKIAKTHSVEVYTVHFHIEEVKTNFPVFVLIWAGIKLLIFHINGNEEIFE
jgi:cbb3-type cytochrome oxidase subunit 1